ncbi:hypothetical protein PICMEDRAFT_96885 [Pichia membranifaciens NRRL Y-2026]|uniref:Secreted protein n=1 Tax=Pichia membranifaciens NRRL Y-2026 TaxID=763406 RepID=A0A1E3NUD1_9ASCO|nr:hypothetical protein PICMEDRAFT_96885 [Pichia membranifaciens NRRL Y-2026]ODQ49183.1 hypothetical protein PICMEDRAFT_96885 [Pichia membranifaciens NRRL Y-2026]
MFPVLFSRHRFLPCLLACLLACLPASSVSPASLIWRRVASRRHRLLCLSPELRTRADRPKLAWAGRSTRFCHVRTRRFLRGVFHRSCCSDDDESGPGNCRPRASQAWSSEEVGSIYNSVNRW